MDIEPGIIAVIVASEHEENLGVVVQVELAYDGELPPGAEYLPSGWWIASVRAPLRSDGVDIAGCTGWADAGSTILIHESNLLPLKVSITVDEPIRWIDEAKQAARRKLKLIKGGA